MLIYSEFCGECFFYNVNTDQETAILPQLEWHDNFGPFPYAASTWTIRPPSNWTREDCERMKKASLMPIPGDDEADFEQH